MRIKTQFIIAGIIWGILAILSFYKGYALRGMIFTILSCGFLLPPFLFPSVVGPLHKILEKFIHFGINSLVAFILAMLYFVIITPYAIILRLLGSVHIPKKFDKNLSTYWVGYKKVSHDKGRYRRVF